MDRSSDQFSSTLESLENIVGIFLLIYASLCRMICDFSLLLAILFFVTVHILLHKLKTLPTFN